MCRYRDGSSFLCRLCSVSEVFRGSYRDTRASWWNIRTVQIPTSTTTARRILPYLSACFEFLCTESDSKSGDSQEDGAFQTPNPCDCWHFSDCKILNATAVTAIPCIHGPPPSRPYHGGPRNARRMTIYRA